MRQRAPRVLIVGGGPAGVGAALTLADADVPALVVEHRSAPRQRPGECLTPNFRPLLDRLRLQDVLAEERRSQAFVSRWDHGITVERPLLSETHGEGWLLDRRRFEARLRRESYRRGTRWQLGWSVEALSRQDGDWQVELGLEGQRRVVAADFVIDATGRSASLLRKLKVRRRSKDKLFGSWMIAPSRGRFQGAVHIETEADGWWYAAPISDERISVVWFSDRAETGASELMARARASDAIAPLLGEGPLFTCSAHAAGSARAGQVSGPGWFAVGDAALAFDPLSSYGIGSALGTGYYAAQALLARWAGDEEAPSVYQALLDQRWYGYLAGLVARYEAPHAFSAHPFWQQRVRRVRALRDEFVGEAEFVSPLRGLQTGGLR